MATSYIIFYLFGGLAAASGFLMVTRKNVIESAAFFLTSLLATGGIFLQLRAEFVFGAQIILYAGGVSVLFFFILLLLNPRILQRQKQFGGHTRIATLMAVVMGALALTSVGVGGKLFSFPAPSNSILPANTGDVARTLFQNYPLALELVPILLLIAMIGAVVMAKRSV
jgi:NADH-quinone oxidoreductase subunit J